MTDENIVPPADVKPPESDAGAEKPASDATVTAETEAPKPNREEELQRAVGAANTARRRLERDLAEERMKWETANQRLAELAKKFTPPEPKPPSPDEDPVGAITHETRQTREAVAALQREREEEKKANEVRNHQAEIERHWASSAQAYAAQKPDFPQAYEHLFKNAMEEFTEAGYDESTAGQLVQGYWRDIVLRARQDGINPAERMYNLAKRRGYKAATSQDKIDTIVNGSKAQSPLSASGKAPSKLTMEALADMKQEDFDKLSDADFKRIAGA